MNRYRTTARVVGIIYILGFVVGIGGNGLIQSLINIPNHLSVVTASSTMLTFGSLLWLLAVVGDVAHGILMFPVLKQYSERIALGYLAFRIIDAVFIAIMVLFLLLQIPLASEYLKTDANIANLQTLSNVSVQASLYAYYIGMSILGIAGLLLNYLFYKAKLIPRWLSVWGLIGYGIIFLGMVSAIMGSGLALYSSIPGGLWEVFIGIWLIVKGFNQSSFALNLARIKK